MSHTLIVTTAMGLESVLKRELFDLGIEECAVSDGRIEYQGDMDAIPQANMWLRTAGRVYIKMGQKKVTTFDMLFEFTKHLPWERWISKTDAFPVTKVTCKKSTLFSKSTCQAIVKKAIVEKLKSVYKVPRLSEDGIGRVAVRITIENDECTLSIDTTGEGLSKRGYREHMDIAPLRETLAAGLILLSRWNPEEHVLLDPMCGTGTLLIEAGLIAKNIAPGLNRTFAAEKWACIPKDTWEKCRKQAKEAIKRDAKYKIYGSDTNHRALSIARKNSLISGLDHIFVQKLSVSEVKSRFNYGKIVTNPPYGKRLGEINESRELSRLFGDVVRDRFHDWDTYVISADSEFEYYFQKKATRKRKLFNGPIRCDYYQFFGKH